MTGAGQRRVQSRDARVDGLRLHARCDQGPARTAHVPDRLRHVTCPTLVLRGAADAMTPRHRAEDPVRRLPDGRLVVVPGQPSHTLTPAPETSAALIHDSCGDARAGAAR